MKILIIDSTNNFVRNYAVVPTLDSVGESNGGVVGFLRSLVYFLKMFQPDKVILVWDGPGGSQKRRTIYPEYKAGRKPMRLNRNYDFEWMNTELNKVKQRTRLSEYLAQMPLSQISVANIEADDVIGYLVQYYSQDEKIIISNDKDFYQLISEKTKLFSPTKKAFYAEKDIYEQYKIYPQNFTLAKAFAGDKSDNIPGVKGIGFKRVVNMFPFFSQPEKITLDQLFDFCEQNKEKFNKILQNKETITNNYKVMQLENPIISGSSIIKIKESLSKKMIFSATACRIMLMKDEITSVDDTFFYLFNILKNKGS